MCANSLQSDYQRPIANHCVRRYWANVFEKRPCVTPFNLDDSGVEYAHIQTTTNFNENSIPATVQPTIHNCRNGMILYIIITIVIRKIIY